MTDRAPLIASRKHTLIFLLIAAGATLLGLLQTRASGGPTQAPASRVVPYLILIGTQLLWVRFVLFGMRRQGHSLAELTGGRSVTARGLAMDLLFAAIGFVALNAAAEGVKLLLGDTHANVSFLLPHGPIESVLWILVSITAGTCEEIAFRGYLQRQLAAMTGSVAGAILLQAAIFGVMHAYQGLRSIASTGAIGLILGILTWRRGNIRAGAIAHSAEDILGGLVRI
jgi:membrane protease YdiL (CAAX protease family)